MILSSLYPRSLQQRAFFFILIPTFLLMVVLSVGGYIFVRNMLLKQWGETAISELQRTAHQIDMRMRTPKALLQLLQDGENANSQIFDYVLKKIKALDIVSEVKVEWPEKHSFIQTPAPKGMDSMMGGKNQYKLDLFEISLPKYNSQLNNRTVLLVSRLQNTTDDTIGQVEIKIPFDEFIYQVLKAPWWKSNKAYLIDDAGNVLASTIEDSRHNKDTLRTFGTVDAFEQDTLAAMKLNDSGMVFGPGSPPEEVSGFYRLVEAPWTMVVMAPGKKVLRPILRFKLFYIIAFSVCTLLILLFIRVATSRMITKIKEITTEANNLADGRFGPSLPVTTRDEVGELTTCFNKMTQQLQQRLLLKEAINIAGEVQQNLQPNGGYSAEGVVVAGTSNYCDETGGDYFDILSFPESDRKVGVVVGDVVGHGIGAALLMTTVRALLRCRITQPGPLNEVINDVNVLLCKDTSRTGSFVTLFYMEIDRIRNAIRWVRGGHDPAIVYTPKTLIFSELKGNGVVLGVDPKWSYECNELPLINEEQIILIGSDGVWEVANFDGEQFGKERIKEIVANTCDFTPDYILQSIIKEIDEFKRDKPQDDDITLAVIKIKPGPPGRTT